MRSQIPITITLLVKDPRPAGPAEIHYHDIGDYLPREKKLARLAAFGNLAAVAWQPIAPNAAGDWVNQRSELFATFPPLGDKAGHDREAPFRTYSLGAVTGRDARAYSFSRKVLFEHMAATIEVYSTARERFHREVALGRAHATDEAVSRVVDTDPHRISWTRALKADLRKNKPALFDPNKHVRSMYRPFCKQWPYFDRQWNEMVLRIPSRFPTPEHDNRVIPVTGTGGRNGCSVLLSGSVPNLNIFDKSRCFPCFVYRGRRDEQRLFGETTDPYGRLDGIRTARSMPTAPASLIK
jgi:predicted helicase